LTFSCFFFDQAGKRTGSQGTVIEIGCPGYRRRGPGPQVKIVLDTLEKDMKKLTLAETNPYLKRAG